jgi:glycosyltransferase involved in cell wall biosynthesis
MTNSLVSIIIPVYNVEKYIDRCLESVLNQTYCNLEIIVVNDCTSDNSMSIVDNYSGKYSNIIIISLCENKGPMRARNVGTKASTGDYIIFCDSDDWLPPNAVELLLKAALVNDADIITGSFQKVSTLGEYKSVRKPKLSYGHDTYAVYKSLLNTELPHSMCGKIFRADLLRDNEFIIYDNFTNSEDKLLMYQLIAHTKKVVTIDNVVYYYLDNCSSSTRDKKKFILRGALNNIQIVSNFLIKKFENDYELMCLLEKNLVSVAISLAVSKSINPNQFIENIEIPCKKTFFSFKNMSRLFSGKYLFYNYIIIKFHITKVIFSKRKYLIKSLSSIIQRIYYFFLSDEKYARKIGVQIGNRCSIGSRSFGSEPYLIKIGDHVQITDNVHFFTHGGGWILRDEYPNIDIFGKIEIKNNVYIGSGSYILMGVTIGNNVVVGARTVVTKSIPDNVVVAGNPAKIIGSINDFKHKMLKYNLGTKGMNYHEKKEFLLSITDYKFIIK